MKEREWEARSKRESEMMAVMQQHLKEQQDLQKQMQEQNKLMLDIMKNYLISLCRKFILVYSELL